MDVTLLRGITSVRWQTGAKRAQLFPCCTSGSLLVLSFLSFFFIAFQNSSRVSKGLVLRQVQLLSRWGGYSPLPCFRHVIFWFSESSPLLETPPSFTLYSPGGNISSHLWILCWKPKQALCGPLHAHKAEIGKIKILPSIPWNSDICLLVSDFHTMPFPHLFYWVHRSFYCFQYLDRMKTIA